MKPPETTMHDASKALVDLACITEDKVLRSQMIALSKLLDEIAFALIMRNWKGTEQ